MIVEARNMGLYFEVKTTQGFYWAIVAMIYLEYVNFRKTYENCDTILIILAFQFITIEFFCSCCYNEALIFRWYDHSHFGITRKIYLKILI